MWRHAGEDRSSLWSVRTVALPEIDGARLANAFAALQSEYEILRSSIELTDAGQLAQSVAAQAKIAHALIDARGDTSIGEAWLSEGMLPDPRECASVLTLYKTDGANYMRAATSKLLLDSTSSELLIEKLRARYAADATEKNANSQVLQYADYAPWAHERMGGRIPDQQTPDAQLPWPGHASGLRQITSFEVPAAVAEKLACACGETGVDADAWFFTAFAVLIRRLSRLESYALNTIVSGRTEAELRDNLGLFEMSVRLVPECGRTQPFIAAVRANAQRLQLAKDRSYEIFDASQSANGTTFAYSAASEGDGNGASWIIHRERDLLVGCELGLRVVQSRRGTHVHWTVDAKKFTESSIGVLQTAFVCLLKGALSQPETPIGALSMLDMDDRQSERCILRGRQTSADDKRLVDTIFAARHADAPALMLNGRTLKFGELNLWSARLAALLAEQYGVRERDTVVLVLGRSIEWIVAALAVLQLGACYAPIDVDAPALRIRALLDKIRPKLRISADAPTDGPVATLPFNAECWEVLGQRSETGSSIEALPFDPDRAAYLLHTSGSSGEPKGVLISEGNLQNYVRWAGRAYGVEDIDAAVLHTSLAVDLTVTSLWVPLFAGKSVEILEQQGSVAALLKIIAADRRWLLKLTPTHLRGIAQYCQLMGVPLAPCRGVMVVGGEQLDYRDLEPWQPLASELRIYNEYGPTETTVGSTCWQLSAAGQGAVGIGKPIDNTIAYVADADGMVLPCEVPGELVIGGAGVAIGYVDDSGQENARFARDESLRVRIYRTGDRARLQPDGTIEYLGRIDDEIKLRGFRIGPKEIENTLLSGGDVAEAAIVKIADPRQGENLVVFCVMKPGHAFDADGLQDHVRNHLPSYMVPGAFVRVDHIPMAPSGKRDLAALMARNPVRAITHAQYSAPRSHVEQVLASVWAYALGVDRVGLDDNYFALGGDSLRSVQITALAEKRHVRLSVAMLHRHPTVRTLAAHMAEQGENAQHVHLTQPFELLSEQDRAKVPPDVVDAYPLNLLQEGMIYHREFRPKSAVYHAICSYTVDAPFDLALMQRAVNELHDRHPLLRTSFDLTSFSRPMQLVHKPCGGNLGFEDLSDLSPEAQQTVVDNWMDREKVLGFEVEEYPLIRFMAHKLGENRMQLSYSFHHEIIDGWSDAWMVTELMNHYMAMVNGESSAVPPPTSTFRDSIYLEQQALTSRESEAFWHEYLAGVNVMKLPSYRAAKADKGEREIVKFEVPISDELSQSVQSVAKSLAVPLKTVLLAAHMQLMSKIGGVDDVLTYIVTNGRPENRDGHAVIGLFVNSLAFRMKLSGGSWADLIYGVLETEHKTLPHRRYPMAELKRHNGSEPLSETLFFFNNYHIAESLQHWANLRLAGLKVYAESTFPYCVNAFVEPFAGKLHIRIEYDRLQYTAALMDDISDLYGAILRSMISDIHARYDSVELVSAVKTRAILDAAIGPKRERPPHRTVLDSIQEQARLHPRRAALRCGDQVISYATLMSDSDNLMRYLTGRGIGRGDVVVLRMERGPDVIRAMLGVLKAGATYIPLDGSVPTERLKNILASCQARLIIGDSDGDSSLGVPYVSYAEASAAAVGTSADLPRVTDGVAYIIFTSGSTGYPKGIACDHASLLNSTLARVEYYGSSPSSFLLLSPHSFDSSIAGIYWTLCGGGTLVLPSQPGQVDTLDICRTIVDREVSHLLCIPSLYATILDEIESFSNLGGTVAAPALTVCIVAGEVCPSDVQARHIRLLPHATLHNEYGPTEATVWSTAHRCDAEATRATLPIGRPITNTTAYVLELETEADAAGSAGRAMAGWFGRGIRLRCQC